MLSQENIDKLHMNGIYIIREPVLEWLPSYKRDTPYWCRNWTFKIREYKGLYYMCDTYFSTDEHPVELTDENISMFKYLFDLNEIKYINSYQDWLEYSEEDRWSIALDSGGAHYPKYVVRQNVHKVKERVVERLRQEVKTLEYDLDKKKVQLQGVLDGKIDIDWV